MNWGEERAQYDREATFLNDLGNEKTSEVVKLFQILLGYREASPTSQIEMLTWMVKKLDEDDEQGEQIRLGLATDTQAIVNALAKNKQEVSAYVKKRRAEMESTVVLFSEVVLWQIFALSFFLSAFIEWRRTNYPASYFPLDFVADRKTFYVAFVKKWWLSMLLVGMFPWSVFFLWFILKTRHRSLQQEVFHRRNLEESEKYERNMRTLSAKMDATKKNWLKLCPYGNTDVVRKALETRIKKYEVERKNLNTQIEKIGRKLHFDRKLLLDFTQGRGGEHVIETLDDATILQKFWEKALEDLMNCKYFRAIEATLDAVVGGTINIYTSEIQTGQGGYGPVRIEIAFGGLHTIKVWPAHKDSKPETSPISKGIADFNTGHYCFGHLRSEMSSAIRDGRIAEAFTMMTSTFETHN